MNLGQYINNLLEQQGRTKIWVADQSNINYKTFSDKLKRNSVDGEELLRIASILNMDLNELMKEYNDFGGFNMKNYSVSISLEFDEMSIDEEVEITREVTTECTDKVDKFLKENEDIKVVTEMLFESVGNCEIFRFDIVTDKDISELEKMFENLRGEISLCDCIRIEEI